MLQQVGDPLGVLDIGLAPRHGFDVLRVDHQQFKAALQQIEHRFPIHARGLEGHVGASSFGEPIAQLEQLLGGRQIGPKLLVGLTVGRSGQEADLHGLLMHIQPRAVSIKNLHRSRSCPLQQVR
jgi:hypothetical protein